LRKTTKNIRIGNLQSEITTRDLPNTNEHSTTSFGFSHERKKNSSLWASEDRVLLRNIFEPNNKRNDVTSFA